MRPWAVAAGCCRSTATSPRVTIPRPGSSLRPTAAPQPSFAPRTTEMGTTRVRLTLELEINGDVVADACTYFIGRFGNYSGENLEAPVEDQAEQVILDVLDRNWPELLRSWRVVASHCEAIRSPWGRPSH